MCFADEKEPAEEEELDDIDGSYKVIKSPGFTENMYSHYWDIAVRRLGELDLSRHSVSWQVGAGGITGWLVYFRIFKVHNCGELKL